MGGDVVGNAPEAYAKIIKDDYDEWGSVVAAAGIKPEDPSPRTKSPTRGLAAPHPGLGAAEFSRISRL